MEKKKVKFAKIYNILSVIYNYVLIYDKNTLTLLDDNAIIYLYLYIFY